jgi:hypothetical protein
MQTTPNPMIPLTQIVRRTLHWLSPRRDVLSRNESDVSTSNNSPFRRASNGVQVRSTRTVRLTCVGLPCDPRTLALARFIRCLGESRKVR